MIHLVHVFNKRFQTLVERWFTPPAVTRKKQSVAAEKRRVLKSIHAKIAERGHAASNIIECGTTTIVFRRCASLRFALSVDADTNVLAAILMIDVFADNLMTWLPSFSELDIRVHLLTVLAVLEETFQGGVLPCILRRVDESFIKSTQALVEYEEK